MSATVSFTLPISCQICLGKVQEPASCDNNHVFCRVCIAVWTSKNEHCPACRTPITSEKPVRRLIGGQNLENDENTGFSQPMIRKARVKSLFNSYEEEIQRLNDKILILEDKNSQLESQIIPAADKPGPDSDGNNKNDSLSDADKETLNLLNAKLSEATQLYQKVSKDILKYQQENAELRQANIDLSRENDRMRYDLTQKTPNKVGRFTVAALESQIDKQKREIDSLHKALSLSDNRIEKLQSQITTVTTTSHKGNSNLPHSTITSKPTGQPGTVQKFYSQPSAHHQPSQSEGESLSASQSAAVRQLKITSSNHDGSATWDTLSHSQSEPEPASLSSVTRVLFDKRVASTAIRSLADIKERAARQARDSAVTVQTDNQKQNRDAAGVVNPVRVLMGDREGCRITGSDVKLSVKHHKTALPNRSNTDVVPQQHHKISDDPPTASTSAHSLIDQNLTAADTMFEKPSASAIKSCGKPAAVVWDGSPVTQLLASAPSAHDPDTLPTTPTKRARYTEDTTLHLDVPSLPSTPSTSTQSLSITQRHNTNYSHALSQDCTGEDNHNSVYQSFMQSTTSSHKSDASTTTEYSRSHGQLNSNYSENSTYASNAQSSTREGKSNFRAASSTRQDNTRCILKYSRPHTASNTGQSTTHRGEDNSIFDELEAQDLTMTSDFSDCLKILQTAERNVRDRCGSS